MITVLYHVIAFLVKKKTALLMNKSYSARLKKQREVRNNKVLTRKGYGYILQPLPYKLQRTCHLCTAFLGIARLQSQFDTL
jgi:hypothetical protein